MEKKIKSPAFSPRYSELDKDCSEIFLMFSDILTEISNHHPAPILTKAQKSFNSLCESYSSLSNTLQKKIRHLRCASTTHTENCSKIRRSSQRLITKTKKKLALKEKIANKTNQSINSSLNSLKNLWGQSLETMQSSLKKHENFKRNIETRVHRLDKEMSQEFANKTLDKELISHESAFERLSGSNELKNISVISEKSGHNSNTSMEFEKCMAELDYYRQQPENCNISIEKSFGGWKSEYESENESFISNPNEIKQAISILKKANLLSTKGGNLLDKLTGLMRSPGNTQRIELLLQLHNIQNKSKNTSAKSSQKPPLKLRKLLKNNDLAATPKAAHIFADDLDLAKTILSSENPLSARHPEDCLEYISEELSKSSELNDVQLEDLLNIPFMMPDLKMASGNIPDTQEVRKEGQKDYLSYLSVLSPSEVKIPSPAKKQSSGFDCQSTGISSQSGLRSRITLRTGGSEASQKVFTPGSRGIEESFKYL